MSGPFVLVPLTLTDAMLTSSTLAEPAAGEVAWNAATNYTVGTRVILASTHRIYENLIAGVNATSPELTLNDAAPRWLDYDPTARWAAFDGTSNTVSSLASPLTYVLRPGLFNGIAIYGLVGAAISVTIKDAPGGATVYTYTGDLQEPPIDAYDYYFGPYRALTKLILSGLVPYADPELTISITAGGGATVSVGMIAIGDMRSLVVDGAGGTQYGATAEPISNSYITTDAFARTRIRRRPSATNLRIRVKLSQSDADSALATMQEVLDVPAAWIASDESGYLGLNAFGLGSGSLGYDGPNHAILSIDVRGTV